MVPSKFRQLELLELLLELLELLLELLELLLELLELLLELLELLLLPLLSSATFNTLTPVSSRPLPKGSRSKARGVLQSLCGGGGGGGIEDDDEDDDDDDDDDDEEDDEDDDDDDDDDEEDDEDDDDEEELDDDKEEDEFVPMPPPAVPIPMLSAPPVPAEFMKYSKPGPQNSLCLAGSDSCQPRHSKK